MKYTVFSHTIVSAVIFESPSGAIFNSILTEENVWNNFRP